MLKSACSYMDMIDAKPAYDLSKSLISKYIKIDSSKLKIIEDQYDKELMFKDETDVFNNNENR
jgi:hypothetical protein